ncbi:glutathione ABC transporter permease [Escherichia coli]|nr:glutathione ABC transporter permease [Escherichia coli]
MCIYLNLMILIKIIRGFISAQPPTPEWGAMLNEARADMVIAPHVAVFPALAIFLTVLVFNLLGDGLRDALDPKIKG